MVGKESVGIAGLNLKRKTQKIDELPTLPVRGLNWFLMPSQTGHIAGASCFPR